MVDSLFFQDGGLSTNHWREYRFVAKGGLSDRMVEGFEGKMIPDWDGSYITVDIVNDNIILRNGWVR